MKYMPTLAILLCIFFSFTMISAFAQPGLEDSPARKRLEELRKIKLIEALNLSEEQSIRFFAREKDHKQSERELLEQRKSAIERLRTLVRANASDADIQKEIANIGSIGNEIIQKKQDFLLNLKDILTMNQIAKIVIFEDTFMEEVRKIIQSSRARSKFRE